MVPVGDADLGIELRQLPKGREERALNVVFAADPPTAEQPRAGAVEADRGNLAPARSRSPGVDLENLRRSDR